MPELDCGSSAPPRWARSVGVRMPVMLVLLIIGYGALQSAGMLAIDANPLLGLGVCLVSALAFFWGYRGLVMWLERRRPRELALDRTAVGLGPGTVLGFILFSAIIGIIWLFGDYRITGTGSLSGAAAMFGLFWLVGLAEEAIFRGVLFRLVEERFGTWIALAASAVIFGGIHLANPNATAWGALAIAIEAGVLFGAIYAATRTLWVVVGLHFAWNFAEGSIFGANVSGNGDAIAGSVWTATFNGPTLVTGGQFGPEASVPAIIVCLVPSVAFLIVAHRRSRIRPRRHQANVAG
ncbi:MAG: CPBP family intramembrane metalloprotease [Frankiaceae bacterium]|jgi:membrane protease YdiL (CAAX protease family)|nr:CPBP family intramembrane metalloprotease [Frankiaceae bacterium]